jgi:hypothetical protein
MRQRMLDRSTAAQLARRSRALEWIAVPLLTAIFAVTPVPLLAQASQSFTPRDETPEEFPPGPGRDETFYACTACHGFKLVAQQGMNRRQWDESLTWMTEKHGMPKLEGDDRKVVLDYLEQTYPPSTVTGGGYQNPFLSR